MRRWAIATVLSVLVTACAADPGPVAAPVDPDTVDRCEDAVDLRKLREELTPGEGRRVTVRALGPGGAAVDADPETCLRTVSPGIDIATARAEADDPAVALLVDPGTDDGEAATSATVAVEVIESLAADVDLGVFGLGPVDDGYSVAAVVSEAPAPWLVWSEAGSPPDGWARNTLLLDDGFESTPTPLRSIPTAVADAGGPVRARTNLVLDESVDPSGLLLSGSHSGGLVLRVGGVEVLRSNLPAGDLDPSSRPVEDAVEPIDFATTVPPERFGGRDNVVSIEWYGAAERPDQAFFEFEAVDRRTRPVAAAPLTGFGHDRSFAVAQVERREPRGLAAPQLAPAASAVAVHLDERRERSSDGPEMLVVVAPHRAPEGLPEFGGDPLVVWVGAAAGSLPAGVHRSIVAGPAAGSELAALVEAHRRAGVWAVGLCGPSEPIEPVIEVTDTGASTSPKLVATVGNGPCDPAAAVEGTPESRSLRFVLTPDQQRVLDQREREADRRPVATTLSLAEGVDVTARLQVRGQSTLDCERKSYSVSLSERVPVPLFDGWQPSEFTLLSLCLDEGYLRTLTTYRLLEALGLSDLRMAMVDVVIGDEDRGAHLLVERADDLVEADPTTVGVVRRRLDRSIQVSEVEWSRNGRPDLILEDYESVVTFAERYDGDDLAGDLDEQMDLDQYLRWLALMSLVENGDYSDEVFFVGDPVARGADLGVRWAIQPWDPDDMFQPCHLDGVLEIDEPSGLTSCAESRIDAAILHDAGVLARFQTQLAVVLDELTPQVFADTLSTVRSELDGVLPSRPHEVMTELALLDPSVVDAETFAAALDTNQSDLIDRFGTRHDELVDRVRERGGSVLQSELVDQLTLLAPTHVPVGGSLPMVVEARQDDGTIDQSVSGIVTVGVEGGSMDEAPIIVRRGRGSTTRQVGSADDSVLVVTLGESGPSRSIAVDGPDASTRSMAGDLTGDQLTWGPDETIVLSATARVLEGSTLTIEPGTRVEVAAQADLDVGGSVESRGTDEAPVVFAPRRPDAPWGGLLHFDAPGDYVHTWFVGGGGHSERAFGHSGSQPVVFAAGQAEVALDRVVVQDGPGKGPSGADGSVTISDSLVTRLDTGGEFVDSAVSIDRSWFLDFPGPGEGDDDNDALYLARSPGAGVDAGGAQVSRSVFIGGADDGIDHNGADVELDGLWIEGFFHECVAFSAGGTAMLSDSVLVGCEQGVEVGYGSPQVTVDHSLVMSNDVGVRFGDEYAVGSAGTLTVENSIVVDNRDEVRNFAVARGGPIPEGLAFGRTVVVAPDADDGEVLTGAVTLTDRLLLGPLSAGVGEADDGGDVGLLSPRPR